MRIGGKVLVVLSFLVLPCGAQRLVVTRTVPNPIANFDLSYIDLSFRGGGPTLFQLQILPPAAGYPSGVYYIEYIARCTTSAVTGLLLHARSGYFRIESPIVMTSNQFFTDQGRSKPALHTTIERIKTDGSQAVLLRSGAIPSGRVTMEFSLCDSATRERVPDGGATIWFDIVAVRYVRLVTPGAETTLGAEHAPETYTVYPQFVWNSDLMPIAYPPGTVKFVVSVFENTAGVSAADVPDSRPLWVDTIPGEASVNYAQYPTSGVRALVPGQVYYWQVKAILLGPVNREVVSELFAFRVADPATSGFLTPTQELILRYLSMILGENHGYVMAQLKGLKPEESVSLSGSAIGIDRLKRLAEDFVYGKRTVTHVEIR